MRLWFAADSTVPLYRQLVTQVVLGILSGDLKPGERLPSTRELARRFSLHPNTVSAGYKQLEQEGWCEARRGSGVYVRNNNAAAITPAQQLDHHIAGFFRAVRELGLPYEAVRERVAAWLAAPPPDHVLLIESDAEVQSILSVELRRHTKLAITACTPDALTDPAILTAAVPVCRPSQDAAIRAMLPAGTQLHVLPITSAPTWLADLLPRAENHLIGVVSRWPEFLAIARTMFAAAGVPADALLFADARKPGWQRGLRTASAVLCDAYAATLPQMPAAPKKFIFPLLADSTREMFAPYSR